MIKKPVLKNKEIHRIGDKVLNAVRMQDEEIDRIVDAPHLFDRVRAGIAAEVPSTEPVASGWAFPYMLRAAFGALLLAAVGFGVIAVTRQYLAGPTLASIFENQINDIAIDEKVIEIPIVPDIETSPVPLQRASVRMSRRPSRKAVDRVKPVVEPKEREMGEFQALTYAGEFQEPGEGGRIVRVELSPASLFAMGIDVPVENSTDKVRADLLISADGVMTGVRLEKKN